MQICRKARKSKQNCWFRFIDTLANIKKFSDIYYLWQYYECLLTDRGEKPVYTRARACIGEERGGLCGPLPEGPPHSLTGGAAHWLYLQVSPYSTYSFIGSIYIHVYTYVYILYVLYHMESCSLRILISQLFMNMIVHCII